MKITRLFAAVIAAAVLALTGCGKADTAAVVDGKVITESGVLAAAAQVDEYASQPMATTDLLNRLIVLPSVLGVLGERDVVISDAAARSAVGGIGDPAPYLVDLARLDLAIGAMTEEDLAEVTARLAELDVELNPRYGTFDATQAAIVGTSPEWIVDAAGAL